MSAAYAATRVGCTPRASLTPRIRAADRKMSALLLSVGDVISEEICIANESIEQTAEQVC